VAETDFVLQGSVEPLHVTISIGVAEFAGDRKRFFHAADRALPRESSRQELRRGGRSARPSRLAPLARLLGTLAMTLRIAPPRGLR
jgi:GGDEF domain-containing protein